MRPADVGHASSRVPLAAASHSRLNATGHIQQHSSNLVLYSYSTHIPTYMQSISLRTSHDLRQPLLSDLHAQHLVSWLRDQNRYINKSPAMSPLTRRVPAVLNTVGAW